MTHLSTHGSYRIGPIPRGVATASPGHHPPVIPAAALAAVVLALLVALVVVLNQGVKRGEQIRAAMSAPTPSVPTRLAHTKERAAPPTHLLAVAGAR